MLSAVDCRQAHQERQEIKDPRAAEDSKGKRASRARWGRAACRATWGYQACRGDRDQRWDVFCFLWTIMWQLLNQSCLFYVEDEPEANFKVVIMCWKWSLNRKVFRQCFLLELNIFGLLRQHLNCGVCPLPHCIVWTNINGSSPSTILCSFRENHQQIHTSNKSAWG